MKLSQELRSNSNTVEELMIDPPALPDLMTPGEKNN